MSSGHDKSLDEGLIVTLRLMFIQLVLDPVLQYRLYSGTVFNAGVDDGKQILVGVIGTGLRWVLCTSIRYGRCERYCSTEPRIVDLRWNPAAWCRDLVLDETLAASQRKHSVLQHRLQLQDGIIITSST